MSFILDALKKSDAERQRLSGPTLLEMPIARPTHRLPLWAAALGLVLIVCIVVLGWLAWRPLVPRSVPAPASATSAPAPAAAPVPAFPAAPSAGAVATPVPDATGPASAHSHGPAAPSRTDAQVTALVAAENPADSAPAVAPAAGQPPDNGGADNLHNYTELTGTLPPLRLDLHVYAASPAERYAFINMHKVREGDLTPEGVLVKQITREGVVLEYRGTEFLLGRQ